VTEKQFCIGAEGQIANDISNLFELKALRSVGAESREEWKQDKQIERQH
jgi:hypothetical protein